MTSLDVRDRFTVPAGYLDTPSMGLPTIATVAATREALDAWAVAGVHYSRWEADLERCRQRWARMAGVPERLVGTASSVVPPLAGVFVALARRQGDVVLHEDEFQSIALPASAAFGDRVRRVAGPYTSETFLRAISKGCGVVALSSISSATGERVDLERVLDAAESVGAQVVVDATQSEGIVGLGCHARRLAALAVAGYKGLLSARGTGYVYVAEGLALPPIFAASPYGMTPSGRGSYGFPAEPLPGGHGLSQSPSWLSWAGAECGLQLLESLDPALIESHATGLAARLCDALAEGGVATLPTEVASPIVAVPLRDPHPVAEALEAAGLRAAIRLGRLRVGFHLYSTTDDADRAVETLLAVDHHLERT